MHRVLALAAVLLAFAVLAAGAPARPAPADPSRVVDLLGQLAATIERDRHASCSRIALDIRRFAARHRAEFRALQAAVARLSPAEQTRWSQRLQPRLIAVVERLAAGVKRCIKRKAVLAALALVSAEVRAR